MKKIAYAIIIIVALALVPTGVLAGSFPVVGVNVTVPDSHTACSPTDNIVFSGLTGSGKVLSYTFFRLDNNGIPVGLASGQLTADASVPFPYPSINGSLTFEVLVQVFSPTSPNWTLLGKGSMRWTVTCILPVVDLTKTANPTSLPEPGGAFQFTLTVTNNSQVPVTITQLGDTQSGATDFSNCAALIGTTLAVGASTSCTYSVTHTEAGQYDNTANVTVEDSNKNTATDTDNETVTVTDVLPTVDLTKDVTPATLPEPGGAFNYTLTIHNTSVEAVTITALTDSNALSAGCLALVGTSIPAGGTVTCAYSVSHTLVGTYPNTANVTVRDNEGNTASDSDDATVMVTPLFHLYFPILYNEFRGCGLLSAFGATVGYEDLPVFGANDYDYNDWVTDIHGVLDYTAPPTCGLERIDLTFAPQARGASFDHAFHMLFTANTFASNGTATLTIFDHNGSVVGSEQRVFNASADNDFTIFPRTSDVYPELTNTREGLPLLPAGRTAHLSIVFDTAAPFVAPTTSLDLPHGDNLFFDPYLFVINTADTVHKRDFRLLVVPEASYLWPEERRAIYNVYQGITFTPGTPPTLTFVSHWWELPHNDCVYGDGLMCSLP